MIEKLKHEIAEREEAKKVIIDTPIDMEAINAAVSDFKNELVRKATEDKNAKIAAIDGEIAVIAGLVEKFEAEAAAVNEVDG